MSAALVHASLVLLAAVVTVTDLRCRVIPDVALLGALTFAVPVCALSEPCDLPERLLAAIGASGFLLAAALARPDGMGLGDVKLAGVLGFYLGVRVVESLLIAFAAGSLAGLVVLARHGWAGRHRTIPFAPFLALGALAAIAAQP
jgi:leader peptidase (prepilin peptidase) / N-methyltransferase